jgi:hypothetical protein
MGCLRTVLKGTRSRQAAAVGDARITDIPLYYVQVSVVTNLLVHSVVVRQQATTVCSTIPP